MSVSLRTTNRQQKNSYSDRQVKQVRTQYFFELRRLYHIDVKNAIGII